MKICEGKIIELDPKKWYWLVVEKSALSPRDIANLRMQNGTIMFVNDLDGIEFVENPDRIKGVVVKEF